MAKVQELAKDVLARIKGLGPWQKAIGTAVLIVLVVGGLLALRGRSDYAPLFSQLSAEDAAAIVAQLDEENIPYRLDANGTAVLVPRDQVHTTRLALAAQGLPRGGIVGLEVLDNFQFGATEFERRMSLLRALQGELTRTISRMDGVENARVHLTLPEPSLFVSQQQPATAAVLLELKPNYVMEPEQVRAVMNLVAGSVENLEPQDVTVIDVHGRLLSADLPPEDDAVGALRSLENLAVQRQLQTELEAGVRNLLEPVFGPGNVVARVWADLNFDEASVERTIFETVPDTQEGILRSVQDLQERFEGTGAPAGVPGVDGNIPAYQAVIGGGDSQYERSESIRNYEVNEIREHRTIAPGSVSRLSVSVVVNRVLSPAEMEAIRDTVAASLGYDENRNDQVNVLGVPFDSSVADSLREALAQEAEALQRQRQLQLIALAVVAGAVLLGALVWFIVRRRRAAQRQREEALAQELPPPPEPVEPETLLVDLMANGTQTRQRQVERLAAERPDDVAQVIRTWLAEDN